jgi:hypothetical protein
MPLLLTRAGRRVPSIRIIRSGIQTVGGVAIDRGGEQRLSAAYVERPANSFMRRTRTRSRRLHWTRSNVLVAPLPRTLQRLVEAWAEIHHAELWTTGGACNPVSDHSRSSHCGKGPNGADFDPETLHDWPKYR